MAGRCRGCERHASRLAQCPISACTPRQFGQLRIKAAFFANGKQAGHCLADQKVPLLQLLDLAQLQLLCSGRRSTLRQLRADGYSSVPQHWQRLPRWSASERL